MCSSNHKYNYIYMIRNKVNKKVYIGRSVNPDNRIKYHFSELRRGRGFRKLQRDFDTYGESAFEHKIINKHKISEYDPKEMEEKFVIKYNSIKNGYNERYPVPKGNMQISTTLGYEDFEHIKKTAESKNMNVSQWLRKLVLSEIEKEIG